MMTGAKPLVMGWYGAGYGIGVCYRFTIQCENLQVREFLVREFSVREF